MATVETATAPISLFPNLVNTDSFIINAFDMHVVAIILMLITGIVAAFIVRKHYSKLFTRWMRLAVAFGFIACIGLFELGEHTDLSPGLHFWHYMHLAVGLGVLYFFYLFTSTWDLKRPENKFHVLRDIAAVLIVLFAAGYSLFEYEVITGVATDTVVFVLMTLSTLVLVAKIVQNVRKINEATKSTFSLKVFIMTATIYSIIGAVSLMMVDVGMMGTALTLWGHTPVTTLARIFQNMFYVAIATLLMVFTFATMRADQYYAPIENFLSQNKKKGK